MTAGFLVLARKLVIRQLASFNDHLGQLTQEVAVNRMSLLRTPGASRYHGFPPPLPGHWPDVFVRLLAGGGAGGGRGGYLLECVQHPASGHLHQLVYGLLAVGRGVDWICSDGVNTIK